MLFLCNLFIEETVTPYFPRELESVALWLLQGYCVLHTGWTHCDSVLTLNLDSHRPGP